MPTTEVQMRLIEHAGVQTGVLNLSYAPAND
jgi:hypothetical protein